jgi:chromosomal replication initiation ATPase DnaA
MAQKKDLESFSLPTMPSNYMPRNGNLDNALIREEFLYNSILQEQIWRDNYFKMNTDQQSVFTSLRSAIDADDSASHKLFFLDAPGGTGKTFVFNSILAYARSLKKISLALESSGISAILLSGGRSHWT